MFTNMGPTIITTTELKSQASGKATMFSSASCVSPRLTFALCNILRGQLPTTCDALNYIPHGSSPDDTLFNILRQRLSGAGPAVFTRTGPTHSPAQTMCTAGWQCARARVK